VTSRQHTGVELDQRPGHDDRSNQHHHGADFLAFSFHKLLAPFGMGVLYARQHLLESSLPFLYGGDMIAEGRVLPDLVEYNALPWKYAAGTPNILGAIVSAQALRLLLDLALAPGAPPISARPSPSSGPPCMRP
jgi:cysteine desulfurase/selenocysteine lyase